MSRIDWGIFPHQFGRNTEVPRDLIGATIICIGSMGTPEEGVVIEYRPEGQQASKQLVLCFNEIGMWINGDDG